MKNLWQRSLAVLIRHKRHKQPIPAAIEAIPPAQRLASESQLLSMFRMGEAQGYRDGYQQGVASVMMSRQGGAYDQPSPNTDPALQLRLEAHKRQEEMKAFLGCETSDLPSTRSGELTRKFHSQKLKPITLARPTQKLNADADDTFLL